VGCGFWVVGHQCLQWLKFAYWQEMTIQDGIYLLFGAPFYSQTGWLGLDKIIQWCVNSISLALWLIVFMPAIWLFGWLLLIRNANI
jgi:hypothetical protein